MEHAIHLDILLVIIEVTAIISGLIIYILHWKIRGRLRRIRCAKMLLAELNIMARIANPYADTDDEFNMHIENSTEILPHNVYDGLVNSASISYLDQPLQEQIHSFYELVITHEYNQEKHMIIRGGLTGPMDKDGEPIWIKSELRKVTKSVEDFLRKHERDRA